MSKDLEKIVANLELCKLIPAGEFEDTALVWRYDRICGFICLVPGHPDETARLRLAGFLYPAPTLEEILDAMASFDASFCGSGMAIGNKFYDYPISAEYALRLWLKLKGIESK